MKKNVVVRDIINDVVIDDIIFSHANRSTRIISVVAVSNTIYDTLNTSPIAPLQISPPLFVAQQSVPLNTAYSNTRSTAS